MDVPSKQGSPIVCKLSKGIRQICQYETVFCFPDAHECNGNNALLKCIAVSELEAWFENLLALSM